MECRVSLTEQERKEKIYHFLVQDVDNHFRRYLMHTGRESHIDSDGEG